jgi:carbonic anhydrase
MASAISSNMSSLAELFSNNQAWAKELRARDPKFFEDLAVQQRPEYLWIGCADSRVPAEKLVGLAPGQVFVHRNVANVIVHTDFNSLSVMQFAVDVLQVKHIIVCGHYGCGGVHATLRGDRVGLTDNWLRHVDDVLQKHASLLDRWKDETIKLNHLCELNVIEQVANVCKTTVVRDAWERGQDLSVHGWIYGMRDGLLRDLRTSAQSNESARTAYLNAVATLPE